MSSRPRAIMLIAAAFVLIAANFLFTAHYVNSTLSSNLRATQKAAAASQKASAAGQTASAAGQKAGAASVSVADLCRAGNAARAEQVGLWLFLIHLSRPPKTAEQRRLVARFEHHLRAVFKPQPCALPRPR